MVQKGLIASKLHENENHYYLAKNNQEQHKETRSDKPSFLDVYSMHPSTEKPRETKTKPRKAKSKSKNATIAYIILPIVGVILIILGIIITVNIGIISGDYENLSPFGITLVVIGVLTFAITLSIRDTKRGKVRSSWTCCDCLTCCDCSC